MLCQFGWDGKSKSFSTDSVPHGMRASCCHITDVLDVGLLCFPLRWVGVLHGDISFELGDKSKVPIPRSTEIVRSLQFARTNQSYRKITNQLHVTCVWLCWIGSFSIYPMHEQWVPKLFFYSIYLCFILSGSQSSSMVLYIPMKKSWQPLRPWEISNFT